MNARAAFLQLGDPCIDAFARWIRARRIGRGHGLAICLKFLDARIDLACAPFLGSHRAKPVCFCWFEGEFFAERRLEVTHMGGAVKDRHRLGRIGLREKRAQLLDDSVVALIKNYPLVNGAETASISARCSSTSQRA